MITLFWSAAGAIALLFLARWLMPKYAPNSRLTEWLKRFVSLDLEDGSDEDASAAR